MSTPKPYRVACPVEGCRRTRGTDRRDVWWICPAHWALVPKAMRRVLSRHKRRNRRFGHELTPEASRRIVARIFRQAGAEPMPGAAP